MLYSTTTVALLAGMMPMASAHYFFESLAVNGVASSDFVRSNTRPISYMPTKWINSFDNTTPDSIDFRCNVGATNKGAKGTAKVKPGDSLDMILGVKAKMEHPGPGQVYMSKAPTTAGAYDGSGEWFKIHQETICNPAGDIKKDAWCTWAKDRISFKIPQGIPDGDYLIRSEHIGLHGAHDRQAEFYYGCAQVTVSGGSGTLPKGVLIPGIYKSTDPEVNFSVWSGKKDYPAKGPGPAVFTPGTSTTPPTESSPSSAPVPSKPAASAPAPSAPAPSAPAPSAPAPSAPAPSAPAPAPAPPSDDDYPTDDYPTDDYPTDDYPTDDYPTGDVPSKPAEVPAAQASADPSKCGMFVRRHARDIANFIGL
ncbi:hypothetical protein HBH56_009730 [Parastagonospora nodorum]|uniref:AA9 family lytic polysaccharide monooxygenase n=2 Tax=Phaeosphaeria nodorum (strain SN15 / ATCC MYA-4574 / FGSC 10173) TaxID=321614 RepID=A0A7U2HTZ9_PHANO|nr:hypothetical protein SNOG_00211 [Parastagonospora nodorum SN15]KAH3920781.1 hypothetical protein HBH56_009730 [Parastagonospora nodorum]EAT91706.1 hypothetical protein SNOG_00211 [Parastagonospora nodorum SN15]KAH3934859.1 hypothetical protein HBH54_043030 [Parastagonospora nodorum]KAH3987309.1 hypothetical protein HBH52_033500 [Parastagonospora nodorum]KAH4073103.1 hypothetical protein HBH50_049600 [Parastagonospora nodorum]